MRVLRAWENLMDLNNTKQDRHVYVYPLIHMKRNEISLKRQSFLHFSSIQSIKRAWEIPVRMLSAYFSLSVILLYEVYGPFKVFSQKPNLIV